MACFVLVHGAWHGGWCWAECAQALRGLGHDVHAPTLTGLGERAHLAHAGITPDGHVADILHTLDYRDLTDVVLVGHSYGGMVITGVAGRVPEKVAHLIYLDAFVPRQSGVSVFANANPERQARFEAQVANGGFLVAPDNFDAWIDDPAQKDWLKGKCTPHPIGCFREGVTLTGREAEVAFRTYILAARNIPSPFEAEYARVEEEADWSVYRMETKHDAMVEDPKGLADLLHRCVQLS